VAEIGIGSTVWVFDQNHREYPPTPAGRLWPTSGPIYRAHWVATKITGENRLNWITCYGKIPKKPNADGQRRIPRGGYSPIRVAFTPAEVDDDVWLHEHARRIAERTERCDVATLKKIAALIGYEPTEGKP
jgi:hypothetical protein